MADADKKASGVKTKTSTKSRTVRDVPKGPTMKEIEKSISAGTKQSLGTFRRLIGW